MRDANWIEQGWSGASKGDMFEGGLGAPRGDGPEWWPRSDGRDLTRALRGLRSAAPGWRALGLEQRAGALSRLLDGWQQDAPGVDELAELLGLDEGALDDDLEAALLLGDEAIAGADAAQQVQDDRALLLRVPAGEFYTGLVRESFPALLAGRPVLFLSDPDLPWLAHDFVTQVTRAGDLAASVALLHDDRSTCWSLALASMELARAYLPGVNPEQVAACASIAPRSGPELPFGAGIDTEKTAVPRPLPDRIELEPLTNSTHTVFEADDPVATAEAVYERAFGAVRALSGQRAGQVGRVVCHQRHFSEFTAALLERMDAGRLEHPCRVFSADLGRYCADLCRLGLDEGATLIFGGPEQGAGFRGPGQRGILAPSVFTNAEPTMGVVRASRPAPVLSLVRATSDAEARAVCGDFSRPPT